MKCRNVKISKLYVIAIVLCAAIVLIMNSLSYGKRNIDLEAIAVSDDETLIACFETGSGYRIRCFYSDGSMAYSFEIPPEISAGGFCTLWFENSELNAYFYRTKRIVQLNSIGQITKIIDRTTEKIPDKFSAFVRSNSAYRYSGNNITVIYEKGNFFEYWILGRERYIAVLDMNGRANVIYSWTASEG